MITPPRILVIEDETDIRENLSWILEAEGYEVDTAPDGVAGLEQVRRCRPDLVLCDVLMPRLDGRGVLKALRTDAETATLPFVFLSALSEHAHVRDGMKSGADDYLTKPFAVDDVLEAVASRLTHRQRLQRQAEAQLDELRQSISRALPHELRTPLVPILGYARLLFEDWDELSGELGREMAQDIYQAGLRLERTVENFDVYASLELAAADPERRARLQRGYTVQAHAVAAQAAYRVAEAHGRAADLHVEAGSSPAALAEEHLAKAVAELVDNAFKFSPEQTPVRVRTWKAKGSFHVEVDDAGRGLRPEDARRSGAFLQFGRTEHEDQGSGLGLVIVRRLAALVGGTLDVDGAPGRGTCVRLTLPAFHGGDGADRSAPPTL